MSDRPLRIVHCVRSPMGGIFKHIDDLSRAQKAEGHSVGLIYDTLTEGAYERAHAERMAPDLELGIVRMPMARSLSPSDIPTAFKVYRALAALRPDVVHCHGSKGGAYGRAASMLLGLRGERPVTVYCPHGGSLNYDSSSMKGRVFFTLERILARLTSGFVFVCAYEEAAFHEKVGARNIASQVVHNGLREEEFVPVTPRNDATDFVFLGTLRKVKGVDVILNALAILKKQNTSATVTITGAGDEDAALRQMTVDLGLSDSVTFAGAMGARDALPLGKCVLLPSRNESFPYVVLEAQGARRPLITTRVGGIAEAFHGEEDLLIPPDDASALADRMAAYLSEPHVFEEAAIKRHARAQELFSAETMSGHITGFYNTLKAAA